MLDVCYTGQVPLFLRTWQPAVDEDCKWYDVAQHIGLKWFDCYRFGQLPKAFAKSGISGIKEDLPTLEVAKQWKHLAHIHVATDLPGAWIGLPVLIIIGANCPKALEPLDIVASKDRGPFAIKTFAGHIIVGPLYMYYTYTCTSSVMTMYYVNLMNEVTALPKDTYMLARCHHTVFLQKREK